jgi:hypothetical protein
MLPMATRFDDLRLNTLSWCRRTRISNCNAARDRNPSQTIDLWAYAAVNASWPHFHQVVFYGPGGSTPGGFDACANSASQSKRMKARIVLVGSVRRIDKRHGRTALLHHHHTTPR